MTNNVLRKLGEWIELQRALLAEAEEARDACGLVEREQRLETMLRLEKSIRAERDARARLPGGNGDGNDVPADEDEEAS
jgi:hypothetical protein